MDDVLARQLLRQLKIINTFMIVIAVTFVTFFIIIGVVVYKAVQEVHAAKNSLNSLQTKVQSSVDFKSQICDSKSSVSDLIKNQSKICE